jgi:polyhydroxyalkanoate synthesis regulator phasin
MASLKSNPMVKRLVETGEAQASKLVQQILSNEKFVSSIQSVVQTTLTAKGAFDRNIRAALGAMNLPSAGDLEQIRGKVSDLESLLAQLDDKVSLLIERLPEKSDKKTKAST